MYKEYEKEKQQLREIIYQVPKLPGIKYEYLDKFLELSFGTKAALKSVLGLGDNYRSEFVIEAKNAIGDSTLYRVFMSYMQWLHREARANRNNLTAKQLEQINKVLGEDDKGTVAVDMITNNSIRIGARDLKFSRYLTEFCTNETYQKALQLDQEAIQEFNGKYQTLEAFTSALFEHASNSKRTVVVSANPLDILLASDKFGSTRSCHALDGEWANGNTVYSMSDITAVVFLKQAVPAEYPFQKVGRMWLYLDKETAYKKFLLARKYGNILDSQVAEITSHIASMINANNTNFQWNVLLSPHVPRARAAGPKGFGRTEPMYFDENHSAFAARSSIVSPHDVASNNPEVLPLLLFPSGTCLECGCKTYEGRNLCCATCLAKAPSCHKCKNPVRKGSANCKEYNGHDYCNRCYKSMFYECAGCHKEHAADGSQMHIPLNSRKNRQNQTNICKACYDTRFTCPACNTGFLPIEAVPVAGAREQVCGECVDKLYQICSKCAIPNTRVYPQIVDTKQIGVLCTPCYRTPVIAPQEVIS